MKFNWWAPLPFPLGYAYAPVQVRKTKKVFANFSRGYSGVFQRNFNCSKYIVLSSNRGQGNFRELEASRPRPRTSKCVLEEVLEAKDVLKDSISAFQCYYMRYLQAIILPKIILPLSSFRK